MESNIKPAPGRHYLLVTGILYIASGIAGIIGLFYLVNTILYGSFNYIIFIGIFIMVIRICVGISGIVYRHNCRKSSVLLRLGIIQVLLDLFALTLVGIFAFISVFVSALYATGAYRNIQHAASAE